MPEDIYRAGDLRGYDFAFDAAGKIIDWTPVLREVRTRNVKLTLSFGMLFTEKGTVGYTARGAVSIPKGSDERAIKGLVYATMRKYIDTVGRKERVRLEQAERLEDEDEEEEEEEVTAGELLGDYGAIPGTVALLSAVTMS